MESDNTLSSGSKVHHIGPGEKQTQHVRNTNDASKGWPPPKNRVQRSSSIRSTRSISSYNAAEISSMASSQNLPAVLNDPRKGKQKDFFTRTWGETFTENSDIPPSLNVGPNYGAVSSKAFERYIKKLNKYCPRHSQGYHSASQTQSVPVKTNNNSIDKAPDESNVKAPRESSSGSDSNNYDNKSSYIPKSIDIPRIFLDPNFSPSDPHTFSQLFPFFTQQTMPESSATRNANNCQNSMQTSSPNKIDSQRRLIGEKLDHYLDSVEKDIAEQVAQKSHHFFQVMTYHDALMTQLTGLIRHVTQLRKRLQHVDKSTFRLVFELCRLKKRREVLRTIATKLELMSSLHKTQPSIQLFLTEKHFSGALDLITTSRDILCDDLKGIVSFRHLSSQLIEIQSFIGKMLLGDFKQYITDEVQRELIQDKISIIATKPWQELEKECSDQLTSVIYGLLRQNSYTFLEVLQEASFIAVKNLIREIVSDRLPSTNKSGIDTVTGLAKDFAEKASSEEWTELLDIMLGSLMLLLRRIFAIHTVIVKAIASANGNRPAAEGLLEDDTKKESLNPFGDDSDSDNVNTTELSIKMEAKEEICINTTGGGQNIEIPEDQLKSLKVTSQEVLVNVSDQVVERISKILSLRSKEPARKLISTTELHDLSIFADILNDDVMKMTGKISSGFQISLQAQSVIYLESFHEGKKSELSDMLEKENWKKLSQSNYNNSGPVLVSSKEEKFLKVPYLHSIIFSKEKNLTNGKDTKALGPESIPNDTLQSEDKNNAQNNSSTDITTKGEDTSSSEASESKTSNNLESDLKVNGEHLDNGIKSTEKSVESESDSDAITNGTRIPSPVSSSDFENKNSTTIKSKEDEKRDFGIGVIYVNSTPFCVSSSAHMFLIMVCDYCIMCSTLPSITSELGLKTAELLKIYNSKISQLVLGAGAIIVSGLKTITIRNMALAKRSLELIVSIVPDVKHHFEQVHHDNLEKRRAESKKQSLDACFRQYDLAIKHLTDHARELEEKMLTVADYSLQQQLKKWNPPTQSPSQNSSIPSANFKALCKQVTKLYESVIDIWCKDAVYNLMLKVHERFIASVKVEVRSRNLLPPSEKINASTKSINEATQKAATRRLLMSEITFYAEWVLQLKVLPPHLLEQAELVQQIFSVPQQELSL